MTLKALRNESFIAVPRDQHPHLHDALVAKFHKLGATMKVVAYETPFLNALARVAVGEGVALVAMGYRSERHDAVYVLHLDDPDLSITPLYASTRLGKAAW